MGNDFEFRCFFKFWNVERRANNADIKIQMNSGTQVSDIQIESLLDSLQDSE
jgi:hypothetical protein